MAGELSIYLTSGQTVKGLYFGSNRTTLWTGSAFAAVSTVAAADYADGEVAFTELATSDASGTGMYVASRPAGITALGEAEYHVVVFASPITPGKVELGVIHDVVYSATDPYALLTTISDNQVTISPLAATVSAGSVASNTLTAYQYMDLGPFVWTCLDSTGTAINLSGHTVYLSVFDPGAPTTALWSVLGVVSGDSSNIVTVSQADTNTGTAGAFGYRLVDTTDDIMLDTGSLTIVEGPNVVTPA